LGGFAGVQRCGGVEHALMCCGILGGPDDPAPPFQEIKHWIQIEGLGGLGHGAPVLPVGVTGLFGEQSGANLPRREVTVGGRLRTVSGDRHTHTVLVGPDVARSPDLSDHS
jgi:hypothetical protein